MRAILAQSQREQLGMAIHYSCSKKVLIQGVLVLFQLSAGRQHSIKHWVIGPHAPGSPRMLQPVSCEPFILSYSENGTSWHNMGLTAGRHKVASFPCFSTLFFTLFGTLL